MNKRKIEKDINNQTNVNYDFSNIKNKINFEQYTKKEELKKKEKNPYFKINWWQFITPACALLVLLILAIKDIFPSGNLNNSSGNTADSIVINNSSTQSNVQSGGNVVVSSPTQSIVSTNSNDFLENSENSKPMGGTQQSTGGTSISSSASYGDNLSSSNQINSGDGSFYPESGNGGTSTEYNAQNGYFSALDLSSDEAVEANIAMSYVYLDTSKSYLDTQKITVKVFLGTANENTTNISIVLINKTTNQSFEIDKFEYFNSDNYPFEYINIDGNEYIYFSRFIELELDLSLLDVSEGTIYLGINPSFNYIENEYLYNYRIKDGYVTFSLFDKGDE